MKYFVTIITLRYSLDHSHSPSQRLYVRKVIRLKNVETSKEKKIILQSTKHQYLSQFIREFQSKHFEIKSIFSASTKFSSPERKMPEQQNKDAEDPIKDEEKPVINSNPVMAGQKFKGFFRQQSKFLRVVTVSAYLFSVSFAALMLSLYYIFLWSKLYSTTS